MTNGTAKPAMPIAPADGGKPVQAFLEHRFFVVGVVFLAFTLTSAGFVMFGPPLCSSVRILTFLTLLSLTGGFFAWTFVGAITVKTRKPFAGFAIVATGGFAVFVLLQYRFDPIEMAKDPVCMKPDPFGGVHRYYNEIAVHTSNVVQKLTEAKHNGSLNARVQDQALTLRTKISSFPRGELSDLQKAILDLYGAQTTVALTLTLDPIVANVRDGRTFASEAIGYATKSQTALTDLAARDDATGRAAVEHVSQNKSLDKAKYLGGLAKVADVQWTHLTGATPSFSNAEIASAFSGLTSQFFRDISASTDAPIKWYCSNRGKEVAPCNAL